MKSVSTPDFVFEDHVLRMSPELLKKSKIGFFHRLITPKKKLLEEIANEEQGQQEELEKYDLFYDYFIWFFKKMQAQRYCESHYDVDHHRDSVGHYFRMFGSGTETFRVAGFPSFTANDKTKITRIPVEKDGDDFNIILFDHPQTQEIVPFGKLTADYRFYTSIFLGMYEGGKPSGFTRNPHKDVEFIGFSTRMYEYLYGKPGQVYYRLGDRLGRQLVCLHGERAMTHDTSMNFRMTGQVQLNGKFLYQGILDSDGTFPFFLNKDDDDANEQSPLPSNVEVLVRT